MFTCYPDVTYEYIPQATATVYCVYVSPPRTREVVVVLLSPPSTGNCRRKDAENVALDAMLFLQKPFLVYLLKYINREIREDGLENVDDVWGVYMVVV